MPELTKDDYIKFLLSKLRTECHFLEGFAAGMRSDTLYLTVERIRKHLNSSEKEIFGEKECKE